jgi:RNA polymerase sigma-70 factor, ECF subfamily
MSNRLNNASHSDLPAKDASLSTTTSPSKRLQGGDAQATPSDGGPLQIDDLIDQHHAEVYRYAFRLCGNQSDAEDLTQQAFLIACEKLHQIRELDLASRWLLVVTRRCFLHMLRTRRFEKLNEHVIPELNSQIENPGEVVVDRLAIQDALQKIPDEFRVVLLMFYFEDLSYKEIAEELDIKIGTVMSRLSRAKRMMRDELTSEPV